MRFCAELDFITILYCNTRRNLALARLQLHKASSGYLFIPVELRTAVPQAPSAAGGSWQDPIQLPSKQGPAVARGAALRNSIVPNDSPVLRS